MPIYFVDDQVSLFDPDSCAGKTSPVPSPAGSRKARTSESFSKRSSELSSIPYMYLDLSEDAGNLLGESYWEIRSPWRGDASMLNTGVSPREERESSLWQILEEQPHSRYYLTRKACLGILRRSAERGKELPPQLKEALEIQAGIRSSDAIFLPDDDSEAPDNPIGFDGYNGDLTCEVTSTLGTNCGMSSGRNGVIQPFAVGIDSKHACATGDVALTLSTTCGSSTGRNGVFLPMAFAQNQRDEVRDLHDVAGALAAQPGMKQQTYITVPPGPQEDGDPPILCLNDQGGQFMHLTENVSGTLRAEEHGHQPILLESNQNHATIRTDGISTTLSAAMGMGGGNVPMVVPTVYENHGIDSRYKGPLEVAPTMSARYGTGGNNVPLVGQPPHTFCIVGNIIDRQPENGGNGLGCQEDVAYTLTATDRHAVFRRQRVDVFQENDVVSTESARQHKDATDLVVQPYQQTVGTLGFSDHHGINNQYVGEDKCVIEGANLIRRLTPLEAERLQGFPDFWTDIPDASDSARYKALGNSVAIPCVDYVVNGMATILRIIPGLDKEISSLIII